MGSKLTPMGALVRGLLAGAAGTAAMDAVWYARYRRGGGTSSFPEWETAAGLDSWEGAPAPAQVGRRVVEGLLQRRLKPEAARLMTNLVHWGYGIAWARRTGSWPPPPGGPGPAMGCCSARWCGRRPTWCCHRRGATARARLRRGHPVGGRPAPPGL